MSFEVTQTFSKTPGECYQTVLEMLPRQGFEILRRRDIAWLVQARQNVGGRWLQLNIQCRPGVQTQVIISCQDFGDEYQEKTIVNGLCEAIRGLLS